MVISLDNLRKNKKAIEIRTGYFNNWDNLGIFYRIWGNDINFNKDTISNVIIHCHGMTSHSELSIFLADELVSENTLFYALDLPGHGRSEGTKGDYKRFKSFIETFALFCDFVFKEHNNFQTNFILSGESMGALVVSLFILLNHQKKIYKRGSTNKKIHLIQNLDSLVSKLIFISPAFKPNLSSGWARDWKFSINFGLNFIINQDKGIIKVDHSKTFQEIRAKNYHDEDPFVLKRYSPRYLWRINVAMEHLWRYGGAQEINIPFYIIGGKQDYLVDVKDMKEFYFSASIAIQHQSIINLFDNVWHHLYTDPNIDSGAWDSLRDWLNLN